MRNMFGRNSHGLWKQKKCDVKQFHWVFRGPAPDMGSDPIFSNSFKLYSLFGTVLAW